MCGRFALYLSHREIREELAAQEWINEQAFVPRYNIAPRTQAPVLLPLASSPASESSTATPAPSTSTSPPPLILHTMKWGLVPHWSKYEDTKLNTINARSENLIESSGMWNSIKRRNRCAVVVNGYYEWMGKGKGKVPYYVKPQQGKGKGKLKLMLLAGMYDSVVLEGKTEAERLWTFTIVTTPAPKDLEWLHDRQPVILGSDEALRVWLDTGSSKSKSKPESSNPNPKLKAPELKWMDLLVGTPRLECYKVPTEVGKVGVESPTFVERVEERRDGIQAMFKRQVEMSPKKGALKPGDKRKREEKEKEDVKKGEKDVKKREKDVKKVPIVSEVIELSSDEEVVVTKKMKT